MNKNIQYELNKISIKMNELNNLENNLREELHKIRDEKANLIAKWQLVISKVKNVGGLR